MIDCPVCWGTHACDLPIGHAGKHQCVRGHEPDEGDVTPDLQPWADPFCFMCFRGDVINYKEKPCDRCVGIEL